MEGVRRRIEGIAAVVVLADGIALFPPEVLSVGREFHREPVVPVGTGTVFLPVFVFDPLVRSRLPQAREQQGIVAPVGGLVLVVRAAAARKDDSADRKHENSFHRFGLKLEIHFDEQRIDAVAAFALILEFHALMLPARAEAEVAFVPDVDAVAVGPVGFPAVDPRVAEGTRQGLL